MAKKAKHGANLPASSLISCIRLNAIEEFSDRRAVERQERAAAWERFHVVARKLDNFGINPNGETAEQLCNGWESVAREFYLRAEANGRLPVLQKAIESLRRSGESDKICAADFLHFSGADQPQGVAAAVLLELRESARSAIRPHLRMAAEDAMGLGAADPTAAGMVPLSRPKSVAKDGSASIVDSVTHLSANERDTKRDKKRKTPRAPTAASVRCASAFKEARKLDNTIHRDPFIADWAAANTESAAYIRRIANDNPALFGTRQRRDNRRPPKPR
jgi:hypothetical protein